MIATTDLETFRFTFLRDGAVIEATITASQNAFQFIRELVAFKHQLSQDDKNTTERVFNQASELFVKPRPMFLPTYDIKTLL